MSGELHPRITFREIEDAEFMAELTRDFAMNCGEHLAQLERLTAVGSMVSRLTNGKLTISVFKGEDMTKQTPEFLRSEALSGLSRSGELLIAIGKQLQTMRLASTDEATEQDREYDAALVEMGNDIHKIVGARKAEEN